MSLSVFLFVSVGSVRDLSPCLLQGSADLFVWVLEDVGYVDVTALSNQRSQAFVLAVHSRTSFAALLIHKCQPVGAVQGGHYTLVAVVLGKGVILLFLTLITEQQILLCCFYERKTQLLIFSHICRHSPVHLTK